MARKPIVLAPEVVAEAVRLYGGGLSGGEVARRMGFSERVVYRSLREAGVLRPKGAQRKAEPTEAEQAELGRKQEEARLRKRELREKRRMRGEHSLSDGNVQAGLLEEMTVSCSACRLWRATGPAGRVMEEFREHRDSCGAAA